MFLRLPSSQVGFGVFFIIFQVLIVLSLIVGVVYFSGFYRKNSSLIPQPANSSPQATIMPSESSAPIKSGSASAIPSSTPVSSLSSTPKTASSETLAGIKAACKLVLARPGEGRGQLSFDESYCQGDICRDFKTKESCQTKDVIKVEGDHLISGYDGEVDCKWVYRDSATFCAAVSQ